jgi:hypothetical protein
MKGLCSLVLLFLALFPANAFALTPAVPEPTSMILIVTGLAGVLVARRFLKK